MAQPQLAASNHTNRGRHGQLADQTKMMSMMKKMVASKQLRRQIAQRQRSQGKILFASRKLFRVASHTLAGCLLLVVGLVVQSPLNYRQIRAADASLAMNLPDGIENILGFVPKSTFKCERDGYFGDIDNDCKIFHLCQRNPNPTAGGKGEWSHWTYACGNQTMFNQLTLTCAFVDEAIPCQHSSQFQYLNEVIHKPAEPFLTDADVTSGVSYYSNRIMSDGARARAFQDSQLFAQIGGPASASNEQPPPAAASSSSFSHLSSASSSALLQPDTAIEANSNRQPASSHLFQSDLPSSFQNTFQPTNRLSNSHSSPSANFQAGTSAPTSSFNSQQQQQQQSSTQSSARQQQQTRDAPVSSTSQNNGQLISNQQASGDLVENHAWHLQHQPIQHQAVQQQQQQFAFSQSWQQPQPQLQQQQPQQQQSQPQAAASNDWRQFSSPQASAVASSQASLGATGQQSLGATGQQSQVSNGAPPNSFEFSISTHHANFGSPFNSFASSTSDNTNTNLNEPRQQQFAVQSDNNQVDLRGPTTASATLAPFTTTPVSSSATLAATTQPLQAIPSTTLPTIELRQSQQTRATTTTTPASTTPASSSPAAATLTTSSTGAPPNSTLAPTYTFSSSQRLQLAQPTQATTSSLIGTTNSATTTTATSLPSQVTTTTTTTTAATSSTGSGQTRRGLAATGGRRQQLGGSSGGAAVRRTNDLSSFDRSHVGFQSERLSSLSRRTAATPGDTPLVMRRSPSRSSSTSSSSSSATASNQVQQNNQQNNRANTNRAQQQLASSGQSSGPSAGSSSTFRDTAGDNFQLHSSALAGGDFWRRSFDAQLMAPKFESILLRRRV